MSKVLLSFGIAEKLQHIYPDVEKLTIDTDDEIVSWPEVAKAFPNVKAIKIREVAKIAEQRTIDSDFFTLFPALESLITDEVVDTDFTNVNPNTLSHLSELSIGRSSSSDLSVLGELPNLKTLTITIKNKALRFYTQANSGLEKVKL
ncbi:leucine-rich repeat protein, partial [Vibrio ichthyoenteri ATCC 700023]